MQTFLNWVSRNWRAIIFAELVVILGAYNNPEVFFGPGPSTLFAYFLIVTGFFLIIKLILLIWNLLGRLFTVRLVEETAHAEQAGTAPFSASANGFVKWVLIIFLSAIAAGMAFVFAGAMAMAGVGNGSGQMDLLRFVLIGLGMMGGIGIVPLMAALMVGYKLYYRWSGKQPAENVQDRKSGIRDFLLSNARVLAISALITVLMIYDSSDKPYALDNAILLSFLILPMYFYIKPIAWGFTMLSNFIRSRKAPPASPAARVKPDQDPVQPG